MVKLFTKAQCELCDRVVDVFEQAKTTHPHTLLGKCSGMRRGVAPFPIRSNARTPRPQLSTSQIAKTSPGCAAIDTIYRFCTLTTRTLQSTGCRSRMSFPRLKRRVMGSFSLALTSRTRLS